MSQLMDQAFAKARQLPEPDQDAIAAIILAEIESEKRWDELFADPRSDGLLATLADAALLESQAGRAKPLDLGDL